MFGIEKDCLFEVWKRLEFIDCPVCGCGEYIFLKQYDCYGFAKCKRCHLHYIQPHPVLKDEYQGFDSYEWTIHYTTKFNMYVPLTLFSLRYKLQEISRLLPGTVKNMLDVGCGNGLYLNAAEQLGIEAIGIDVDEKHVMFAKSRGLHAHHAKIEDFAWQHKFDFVHIKAVLHLVRNPVSLINHACEMLVDDGVLYIDASNQGGLFAKIRRLFFANPKRFGQIFPPLHNMSYTKKSFLMLLEKSDLECLKLFTFSLGNKVYYPSQEKKLGSIIFRLVDALGRGSFVAAYCRKS